MNRYQSHKIVDAAKISDAIVSRQIDGSAVLQLEGVDAPMSLTRSVWDRIAAMAKEVGQSVNGGWLVVYDVGTDREYTSWSPAEPFEEGYDLVQPSSGKSKIAGYRELTELELVQINNIKDHGRQLGYVIEYMRSQPDYDQRWVSIGATELQQGLMALTRAVAKPEFF